MYHVTMKLQSHVPWALRDVKETRYTGGIPVKAADR